MKVVFLYEVKGLCEGPQKLSLSAACRTVLKQHSGDPDAEIGFSTLKKHASKFLKGDYQPHGNMLLSFDQEIQLVALCRAFYYRGTPLTRQALCDIVRRQWR